MKTNFIFYLLIVLVMMSCADNDNSDDELDIQVTVTSLEITSEAVSILKNNTTQLSIIVSPANASDKTVIWSSSDEAIATVSANGLVTGLVVGTVTISASAAQNESISNTIDIEITGTTTNAITSLSIVGTDAILLDDFIFGLQLPLGTNLTDLLPSIAHNGGTISPSTDLEQDFSSPVTYTVTSDAGVEQEWIIKVLAIQEPPNSPGFITTWVTNNEGASDINQIAIPIAEGTIYDYNVDWGDGTFETNLTGNAIHTYEIPGKYSIAITGEFPEILFNDPLLENNTDAKKLVFVNQWGNIQWSNFTNAFRGCTELDVVASDTPDMSNVFRVADMFNSCKKLIGNDSFGNWDVSNILNASSMFWGCELFNQDIGNWNISNITRLDYLFSGAKTFNQDIGGWDLRNAEIIFAMFNDAAAFNQDISNWNFPKVTSLSALFQGADSFNQDISAWDVSKVEDFVGLFSLAKSFNQPIGTWDMSAAKNTALMFQGADSFTSDIRNWNVSNLENMGGMFSFNPIFNQDISGWNVGKVTSMGGVFWNNSVFNQDLSSWDTSNVVDMGRMFFGAFNFNQSIENWDVGKVQDMKDMFSQSSGISTENYDATIIAWNNLSSLQNGVELDGGNSKYCLSETVRQNLIDTYGWIITDGGKDCN
jgi:surface protein